MPKISDIPIVIPPVAKKGETPITAKWANTVRDGLYRLANRGIETTPRGRVAPPSPPYWPTFWASAETDPVTYYVRVDGGMVVDHGVNDGDALTWYECSNQYDGDGNPQKFEITSGKAVYVYVYLTASGAIGSPTPCEIVIDVDGLDSLTNAPPIEGDYGSAGAMVYKLATFTVVAGRPVIEYFMAGSNIEHFRKPIFAATGITSGTVPLFTKYDLTNGRYAYKGIKGEAPVEVSVTGAAGSEVVNIAIDGDYIGGATGSLTWEAYEYDPVTVLSWANGLITGGGGAWTEDVNGVITFTPT